ncbi:hypothetical protein SCLCIDRAFT_756431 [Scleroderma citrinum Foug A]|uniref:Uncharacterized protein n=1 Tax=Scleroderma citrinum Foug A TaxID=1036808 RepID=A0A0C2ZP76_9AGAM|nr:hypothetical protein SCLCIDRAFT_756431 [Scleroderma citrinum Foug A]
MCDGARVYMGARGARQGVDDPNGLEVHGIALNENTVRHAERCKKKKHLRNGHCHCGTSMMTIMSTHHDTLQNHDEFKTTTMVTCSLKTYGNDTIRLQHATP